jgi:MoaA/NifB/PqqE/SkfB family radical SAM enzyme
MSSRYNIVKSQAYEDYQNFISQIQTIIETPDLDPVTFLNLDRQVPFTGHITAPYRLDCALTYRLPVQNAPEDAPTDRVERELSTSEWNKIINKAWDVGIPQIVFTGGEPTLRDDLPELIFRAESNNQITGLLTDGLRFADKAYLNSLLQTGLDHVMILLNLDNEKTWVALENALDEDLFVASHITLSEKNEDQIEEVISRIANMGVHAISLSALSPEFTSSLDIYREKIAQQDLDLVWNLPVPYSAHNPISFETFNLEEIEGAGRAWLYVEPDGDVLTTQGSTTVLGNFLNDPWNVIWKTSHN